jgi:hypothetical protein
MLDGEETLKQVPDVAEIVDPSNFFFSKHKPIFRDAGMSTGVSSNPFTHAQKAWRAALITTTFKHAQKAWSSELVA